MWGRGKAVMRVETIKIRFYRSARCDGGREINQVLV